MSKEEHIGPFESKCKPQYRSGGFPVNSRPNEREAARTRRQQYAYRFPRDRRQLDGKYSVEENARRLLRFFYLERRLAQGLGSWTLTIPDFEVMVETGRHIFWHADAAHQLRQRLHEQEMGLRQIDDYRDGQIDLFVEEVLSAVDAPELLVGIHQVAGQACATAYRHHVDDTDSVTDAPTIRVLNRILLDYEPMLDWATFAIDAYVEGGIDESRLSRWRWHLQRLLGSIGGVTGSDQPNDQPTPLRCKEKPYERGTVPMRDDRFVTFSNTGDYDVVDGEPRFGTETYEGTRLRFIRTQRDEVDAIEAFGTFLWDIRFKDFMAEYYLARITWDEARHTEIGHRVMLAMGYDPFELPNRLTSSTCRGEMTDEKAAFAMAEINLFGEVGVLRTINDLIDLARDSDDAIIANMADYIRADERTHVRNGQHILKVMTRLGAQELEQRTREIFTECLVSLGAVKKDSDVLKVGPLSREAIEKLVGE